MTISVTETHLDPRDTTALNGFLRAVLAQTALPYCDRRQDRARQRARRWGLAYFDKRSRTWFPTDAGIEYVTALAGEVPK